VKEDTMSEEKNESNGSTELAPPDQAAVREWRAGFKTTGGALVPADLGQAMEMARLLANSKMVPKTYQGDPGSILAAVQMGAEVGLSPMQALQNIASINGRPSLWGDGMLAVVMGHRDFVGIEEMDLAEIKSAQSATCTIHRKGMAPVTRTFTMADAKEAGLVGKQGPWKEYPNRMLQMRARAFACRDTFPDALRGIHSAEESMDVEAEVVSETVHGAGGVKARVVERAQEPREPTALDEVLADIEAAGSVDDLTKINDGERAKSLSEEDKRVAFDAVRKRVNALAQDGQQALGV
jgi:hypothetical protein